MTNTSSALWSRLISIRNIIFIIHKWSRGKVSTKSRNNRKSIIWCGKEIQPIKAERRRQVATANILYKFPLDSQTLRWYDLSVRFPHSLMCLSLTKEPLVQCFLKGLKTFDYRRVIYHSRTWFNARKSVALNPWTKNISLYLCCCSDGGIHFNLTSQSRFSEACRLMFLVKIYHFSKMNSSNFTRSKATSNKL